MTLERETVLILVLLVAVLAPLWFFAFQTTEAQQEVELDEETTGIAPTERFLPTPPQVSEFVAGVVTWVALLALVGMLFLTNRLILRGGRTAESRATDGGTTVSAPSYVQGEDRRLVDYRPAESSTAGLVWLAATAASTVVFAVLFTLEALGLARTQYLGVFGGLLFLSLGLLVAAYATWFLPTVRVAEARHGPDRVDADDREGER